MFTLFSSKPDRQIAQLFSLFNIGFAVYDLCKTPDRFAFLTMEIAIEAATALSLRDNVGVAPRAGAVALNLIGFGMYLGNTISPCAHGTLFKNIIDTTAKLAFAGQIFIIDIGAEANSAPRASVTTL